jgi:hypothetical protein
MTTERFQACSEGINKLTSTDEILVGQISFIEPPLAQSLISKYWGFCDGREASCFLLGIDAHDRELV